MADRQSEGNAANQNLNDPDNYENLDLSFDDLPMEDLIESTDPSIVKKPSPQPSKDDEDVKCGKETVQTEYILGTLIVRVVAARDLESVGSSGLGKLFFGGDVRSHSMLRSRSSAGSANPYASVRFGNTTQRTSEVFDTVDPIWPRGETMYMDVIHGALESSKSRTPTHACAKKASSIEDPTCKKMTETSSTDVGDPQRSRPILTVALFHASEMGKLHKFPSKGQMSGDSDDRFLGMTAVDLTELLTGKLRTFDQWLPLSGSNSDRATVRIVCEYEASDVEPQKNDMVRFTDFCQPADLYPLHPGRLYKVEECDGDDVLISYTSHEGWVSSFLTHRYMLICEERHSGAMEVYQNELASISQRIAHSPLVSVVQETVERVPDEGLVGVGVDAVRGGASLLTRWIQGGIGTAAGDLAYATNWDGRFNPDAATTLSTTSLEEEEVNDNSQQDKASADAHMQVLEVDEPGTIVEPLPNMPACPITGEAMRDPVVAADGHTYERSAIARWLKTSDKSPLTGSILSHKNLVPNYMLLSSLQDAAVKTAPTEEEAIAEEDDATTEVNIDD